MLFYGCRQTDTKVSMERQKTQKSQHNIEEKKIGVLTLPNFRTYYNAIVIKTSNQDSVVKDTEKEQTSRTLYTEPRNILLSI